MEIIRRTLSNGFEAALVRHPRNNGIVYLKVYVDVGSNNEFDPKTNGISHLLEHMAFKGTTTRTANELSELMDNLGSTCNAYTSNSKTVYMVDGLPENYKIGMDFLADIMKNSLIPADELEKEKQVVIQELFSYDMNLDYLALYDLISKTYADQPIGRRIIGTLENVQNLTRDDLLAYMRSYYYPNNMTIIAEGDIDPEEYFAEVEKLFGDMVPSTETIRRPDPSVFVPIQQYVMDGRFENQCDVTIMYPMALSRIQKRHASFLCSLLSNGFSSPIFQELREKNQLCYGAGAFVHGELSDNDSLFVLGGNTTPDKVYKFIERMNTILPTLVKDGISEAVMQRTKNQARVSMTKAYATPSAIAELAYRNIRKGDPIEPLEERMDEINSFTQEDIINFAKLVLSIPVTTFVYGGYDTAIPTENRLGIEHVSVSENVSEELLAFEKDFAPEEPVGC